MASSALSYSIFSKCGTNPSVICRISGKSSANMVKISLRGTSVSESFPPYPMPPAVFPNAVLQKEHRVMRWEISGHRRIRRSFIEVIRELPESQMYHVFSRFGRRRLFLFFYVCGYLLSAVQDFFFFQLPLCSRCRQQLSLQPHTAITGCGRKNICLRKMVCSQVS